MNSYSHPGVDIPVHGGIGEGRVVQLVMAPAAETHQIHKHIPPELLTVLKRQPTGAHHILPGHRSGHGSHVTGQVTHQVTSLRSDKSKAGRMMGRMKE